MWKEFKEFIAKGNVLDLAIGIIMGTAFTAIVNSIVEDLLMPIIGGLTAGVNYEDIVVDVFGAQLRIGNLINAIVTFLIISLVMFSIIKVMRRNEKQEIDETKECPYCKSSIPIEASRCPHCTSILDGYEEIDIIK